METYFNLARELSIELVLERIARLSDRTLRERIAHKAYEMAKAHFSIEEVERSLRQLYNGLYKD